MSHRTFVHPGTAVLAAMLMAVAWASAIASTQGPVVALPGGYYLQPDKQWHTEVVDRRGHRILQGTVAAYAVSGQVVAGAEGDPPANSYSYTNDLPYTGTDQTRYFVLDTASGKLDQHLDAAAWHKRLQELGVPPDFRIFPPLRWQQL